MSEVAVEKLERLKRLLTDAGGAVVAYSGGVDSAFLADVAHEALGARALAVTAVSPSLAPDEREAAARVARERGWAHREVETHEMARAEYRANAPDRCYHCKAELLDVLGPIARERGWTVMVGTNADDEGDYRPGQRAARERGARSPMLEVGLRKDEIRALSRSRGLPTAEKPASPCLSSRIAYGIEVTPARLERIARAEAVLRELGLRDVRVRDHGDLARVEVPKAELVRIAEQGEHLAARLRGLGFAYVTLDLEGFRSGSLNETILRIGPPRRPGGEAAAEAR